MLMDVGASRSGLAPTTVEGSDPMSVATHLRSRTTQSLSGSSCPSRVLKALPDLHAPLGVWHAVSEEEGAAPIAHPGHMLMTVIPSGLRSTASDTVSAQWVAGMSLF